jgi:hypothetical protein
VALVELSPDDLLYFLHIPKTAGTTFYDILSRHFPPDMVCPPILLEDFVDFTEEQIARFRLIGGHFRYDVEQLFGKKPIYVTMLREPLQQTISLYLHLYRSPDHPLHPIVRKQTFFDFVTSDATHVLVPNYQLRNLVLDTDYRPIAALGSKQERRIAYLKTFHTAQPLNGASPEQQLEVAKARLAAMPFVGIVEHFDCSVQLLAYTFGWSPIKNYVPLNVADKHDRETIEITPAIYEALKPSIALDMLLYQYASDLFWQRYRKMVDDLKEGSRYQLSLIVDQQAHIVSYEAQLNAIYASWGWKFLMKFAKLRRRLFPEGSARERSYLVLRNWLTNTQN